MDQTMYGYQQQPAPQYFYGFEPNPGFAYQPVMQQNMAVPQNQNALTSEEIQRLRSTRPSGTLNLNIDQDDVLRAMCTHKENGRDLVQLVQDGSGDVYCPICGERWNPEVLSKEEVTALVGKLIAQMQNSKWTGEFPSNVVREYYSMIPLLRKFPDLFEYGSKNFERFLNQRGIYNAGDANIYAQYNSLYGPGMGYGAPMYQQPMYPYAQQPQGYYQQPVAQPANPAVNPMQVQQPVYGAPGYNPQFSDQANMMMGGTYYAQPVQPMYGQSGPQFTPVYGAARPQQPAAPAAQPQAAAPQTATVETKVDL